MTNIIGNNARTINRIINERQSFCDEEVEDSRQEAILYLLEAQRYFEKVNGKEPDAALAGTHALKLHAREMQRIKQEMGYEMTEEEQIDRIAAAAVGGGVACCEKRPSLEYLMQLERSGGCTVREVEVSRLKGEAMHEDMIAEEMGISQQRVSQLWMRYKEKVCAAAKADNPSLCTYLDAEGGCGAVDAIRQSVGVALRCNDR